MIWAHLTCVGESTDYAGVWSCLNCRLLPKHVLTLVSESEQTNSELTALNATIANMGSEMTQLRHSVTNLNEAVSEVKSQNTNLLQKVDKLENENSLLKQQLAKVTQARATKPKPSLIIGSSMIRDLEPINPNTLDVKSISGANLTEINKQIESLAKSEPIKYDAVYIVGGSIDCESEATTQTIADVARTTVSNAMKLGERVVLSSILPRTDNGGANMKGENVNPLLKDLSNQINNVTFCDNDGSFRLADGSPNDAYLMPHGHHLNYKGSERLAKNLNVPAKIVTKRVNYQHRNQYYRQNIGMYPVNVTNRPPPLLPNPPLLQRNDNNNMWENGVGPTPPRCENCKSIGHTAYSCPRTANVLCYNCRSTGHRQIHCLA
jgi:regulator of replication initiation timing